MSFFAPFALKPEKLLSFAVLCSHQLTRLVVRSELCVSAGARRGRPHARHGSHPSFPCNTLLCSEQTANLPLVFALRQLPSFLLSWQKLREEVQGFERDIRKIVHQLPEAHQTLFFSATWPEQGRPDVTGVMAMAEELLSDAVKVTVGRGDDKISANKAITQRVSLSFAGLSNALTYRKALHVGD